MEVWYWVKNSEVRVEVRVGAFAPTLSRLSRSCVRGWVWLEVWGVGFTF